MLKVYISSCLEKLITKKERQMKLTRFIFSRRFEVIVTPLSSDKYLQVLEFKKMESIICILGAVKKKSYTNNFALIESLWTLREGDNSLMYSIS